MRDTSLGIATEIRLLKGEARTSNRGWLPLRSNTVYTLHETKVWLLSIPEAAVLQAAISQAAVLRAAVLRAAVTTKMQAAWL
jgi:hypothetical protein